MQGRALGDESQPRERQRVAPDVTALGRPGLRSAAALVALQRHAGNRAVVAAIGRERASLSLDHRAHREFVPLPEQEDEDRSRASLTDGADHVGPGVRHQAAPGTAAPTAPASASAAPAAATTPRFPSAETLRNNPTVRASIDADWRVASRDYGERFAWIMWNSTTDQYSITGRATGTWLSISVGPRPNDAPPLFHVGEYHLHPPLPPAQRPNTANYPVAPSRTDIDAANAADNPGLVRDFTDTTRRKTRTYKYGPARRANPVH